MGPLDAPAGGGMTRVRLLAVATLLLAASATAACAPAPQTVTLTIRHSAFEPAEVRVPAGAPVTFVLVNTDPIDHEWLIGDDAFHAAHRTGTHASHGHVANEVTIEALGTSTTTLTFKEPGTIDFICHLPAHEAYGMVGRVIVEG
jgi:plastocyanin